MCSITVTYCELCKVRKDVFGWQDIWPAPLSLFRPVLEEEYHKEDPFLTETPETAYQKGTVDKIPWICGQAEDEGYTFLLCIQL